MIKVISFTICPFVQRVTALLEAKKIPYEIEFIQLRHKPEWFLEISPTGQVPVLVTDNGTALFESDAIIEYLDETSQLLEQNLSPEQRALDRAWSYQATKHYLAQCSNMRSGDQDTYEQRFEKLSKAFFKAESAITEGPFFKGSELSNVDIAWLPLLHRADIIRRHSGFNMLQSFPKVQRWQQRLIESDLTEKSVAPDFEEKFVNFYLAETTWLGQLMRGTVRQRSTPCNAKVATGCCG